MKTINIYTSILIIWGVFISLKLIFSDEEYDLKLK